MKSVKTKKKNFNVIYRGQKYKVIDIVERELYGTLPMEMYKLKADGCNMYVNPEYCVIEK